ncbi:MAG: hypothetical protein KDD82_10050 [Planctomycetes bacterium]|nr:hypothetical protein [Planctomycetota bacterium]
MTAPQPTDRDPPPPAGPARPTLRPLAAALALYLVVGALAAWGNRDQVNPDGLSYLQLATCLAQGTPSASVSGYWSPLLIWSLAPLLALGVSPLIAARVTLLLWGALGLVATRQLALRFELPPWPRAVALGCCALALADLTTRVITPDVVIGSCLLAYAAQVTAPALLEGRRSCVACALGGLAFLAKSYALPFVVLHFPLTVYLRYRQRRGRLPAEQHPALRRRALRAAGLGFAALLLVVGPWVATLSWKHSRLTWSTVGPLAYAAAGPGNEPGTVTHPLLGVRAIPSPHLSIWERPELMPYPAWSPLASTANALHQARIVKANLWWTCRILASWDPLYLGPCFLLLGTAFVIARRPWPSRWERALEWLATWTLGTCALYCAGYLLVYVDERYLSCFLLPLTVLWVLRCVHELCEAWRRAPDPAPRARRAWPLALAAVFVAFSFYPASRLARRATQGSSGSVARQRLLSYLDAIGWEGAFAVLHSPGPASSAGGSTEDLWREGQRISFLLQRPFAGADLSAAVEARELDLAAVNAVLHYASAGSPPLELDAGWGLAGTLAYSGGRLEVWVRR